MATSLNQTRDPIHQIVQWFETAVPDPSDRNMHTQIGVHFEEVFEMTKVLSAAGKTGKAREQLKFAADVLSYFQRQLKSGFLEVDLDQIDRTTVLDALCDQIVTAIGIAHMFDMDIEGALREVADSNDSKFGEDGRPIFNEQRKIMKGPNYKSPDLAAYTTKRSHKDG